MILYIGTYTQIVHGDLGGHGDGIYCYDFNPETGELVYRNTTPAVNPSYQVIDAQRKILYSTEELVVDDNPSIYSYQIQDDASLAFISKQPIPGGFACHVKLAQNGQSLLVACYETGNLLALPTTNGHLATPVSNIQHSGSSVNPARQEGPHVHMAEIDPLSGKLLICDLGIDQLVMYQQTSSGIINPDSRQSISFTPGYGPRHMAIHPDGNYVFVFHELVAYLSVLKRVEGSFEIIGEYPTLPEDFQGLPSGAAIRCAPDGKHVYVSNREADTIAGFQFDAVNGTLHTCCEVSSHGKTPRDFSIDPTGKWLLVANQDSDHLSVFSVNPENGKLTYQHRIEVKSPICLNWYKM